MKQLPNLENDYLANIAKELENQTEEVNIKNKTLTFLTCIIFIAWILITLL